MIIHRVFGHGSRRSLAGLLVGLAAVFPQTQAVAQSNPGYLVGVFVPDSLGVTRSTELDGADFCVKRQDMAKFKAYAGFYNHHQRLNWRAVEISDGGGVNEPLSPAMVNHLRNQRCSVVFVSRITTPQIKPATNNYPGGRILLIGLGPIPELESGPLYDIRQSCLKNPAIDKRFRQHTCFCLGADVARLSPTVHNAIAQELTGRGDANSVLSRGTAKDRSDYDGLIQRTRDPSYCMPKGFLNAGAAKSSVYNACAGLPNQPGTTRAQHSAFCTCVSDQSAKQFEAALMLHLAAEITGDLASKEKYWKLAHPSGRETYKARSEALVKQCQAKYYASGGSSTGGETRMSEESGGGGSGGGGGTGGGGAKGELAAACNKLPLAAGSNRAQHTNYCGCVAEQANRQFTPAMVRYMAAHFSGNTNAANALWYSATAQEQNTYHQHNNTIINQCWAQAQSAGGGTAGGGGTGGSGGSEELGYKLYEACGRLPMAQGSTREKHDRYCECLTSQSVNQYSPAMVRFMIAQLSGKSDEANAMWYSAPANEQNHYRQTFDPMRNQCWAQAG